MTSYNDLKVVVCCFPFLLQHILRCCIPLIPQQLVDDLNHIILVSCLYLMSWKLS